MIKIVDGNLLDTDAQIICHQVNPYGIMGGGVARQIKEKWPQVFEAYADYCKGMPEAELLGDILSVPIVDNDTRDDLRYICNLFGQTDKTDYKALQTCLNSVRVLHGDKSIAMPYKIGCGLGGGDWDIVYTMIEDCFEGCDVTLYKWEG